jgi:adenylate kinase family enzyme
VLGPPAAGKRTLASILGRRANAVVLDEAAILSDAIDDGVDAARALQELRDAGKFVDPMLLVPLVLRRVKKADCLKRVCCCHCFAQIRAVPSRDCLWLFCSLLH